MNVLGRIADDPTRRQPLFQKHLADGSDQPLAIGRRKPFTRFNQTAYTRVLYAFGHLAGHTGGRRALPTAKGKNMQLRKSDLFAKAHGFLKLILRFAWKAYDNIRCEGSLRIRCAQALHSRQKLRGVVAALHAPQNFVAPALQRQMKLRA